MLSIIEALRLQGHEKGTSGRNLLSNSAVEIFCKTLEDISFGFYLEKYYLPTAAVSYLKANCCS